MHGGDADEFIDYMNDGEASVRHRSFVYRFSGLKYHAGRHHAQPVHVLRVLRALRLRV